MIENTQWYQEAHHICEHLGQRYGYTTPQVAGIVAALSPLQPWHDNLKWAITILSRENPRNQGLRRNYDKAMRIKGGEPPSQVLRGLKVRSFYANILRPWGSGPVTIDRHMLRIMGHQGDKVTKGQYYHYSQSIKRRASYYGLKGCEYQALLWVYTRGPRKQLDLFEGFQV